ncbi:MAG TPA: AraC family transcriptional regulator [Thermomicrobiales bacterium]|nr:AraC family transcriptional regulator [Thermomicrobiales bacterium]
MPGITPEATPPRTDRTRYDLAAAIAARAHSAGVHPTAWPGLDFVREDHPRARGPVVLEPCVCFVVQGCKRAFLGSEVFTYDPLRYLNVAVPVLVETEIVTASPEHPYLAVRLRLQPAIVSDLLLELGDDLWRQAPDAPQRGIYTSSMDDGLHGAVHRLVESINDPADRRVLAPLAEREVVYRLLMGEQGTRLRDAALRDSQTHRISQVIRYLHTHYDEPLDIATLADVANMSPSTLHHVFRAVTTTTPLQCLKQIRLYRARLLMLHDGLSVGEAAHRVGYGSPSQFSREYRRRFEIAPRDDIDAHHRSARPYPET